MNGPHSLRPRPRRQPGALCPAARWPLAAGLPALLLLLLACGTIGAQAAGASQDAAHAFPPPLSSYGDSEITGLGDVLQHRIRQQPLNLWAALLFFGAILHTFFTHRFQHWAHLLAQRHQDQPQAQTAPQSGTGARHTSVAVGSLHFLGEVEAVFGIWCVPLFVLLAVRTGWDSAVNYFSHEVRYVEAVFVVVIMALASTRPILQLAESGLRLLARLGGGGPGAWWLAILTLGPVLGSLITEPAAMTISALLLAKQVYARQPSPRLAYGTLGLLFVNVSVGGVLTHFAAPPVLMVAAPWGWTTAFLIRHFGWVALMGILLANALYYVTLRKELQRLREREVAPEAGAPEAPPPVWVTAMHVAFMAWSVLSAHEPALLIGGFLFFLAFYEITREHQSEIQLRSPLLVGFFLAGLVIHGGLQRWWIAPMLARLADTPLMVGATVLTAFNDNAAITYLATLVPNLNDGMKHAVVSGALVGGGLTVIANAPNPAGQAILARFFHEGIAPFGLLLGALPATVIMFVCFLSTR